MLLTERKEVFRWLPAEFRGRLLLPSPHTPGPAPCLTFAPCVLSLDLHLHCFPPEGGCGRLRGHRCDCLGVLVLCFLRCGFPMEGRGGEGQAELEEGCPACSAPLPTPRSINQSKEWTGQEELLPGQTVCSCHPGPRGRQVSLSRRSACSGEHAVTSAGHF